MNDINTVSHIKIASIGNIEEYRSLFPYICFFSTLCNLTKDEIDIFHLFINLLPGQWHWSIFILLATKKGFL